MYQRENRTIHDWTSVYICKDVLERDECIRERDRNVSLDFHIHMQGCTRERMNISERGIEMYQREESDYRCIREEVLAQQRLTTMFFKFFGPLGRILLISIKGARAQNKTQTQKKHQRNLEGIPF